MVYGQAPRARERRTLNPPALEPALRGGLGQRHRCEDVGVWCESDPNQGMMQPGKIYALFKDFYGLAAYPHCWVATIKETVSYV
jgi:hypothetical protein